MYLSDNHIKKKLSELNISCDDPENCFDPDNQIQSCSIDLRLSNVFWTPKKGKAVDLRKSALLELAPRRYWKKSVLRKNECITIKPGQLLLGRVYEKFTIPNDCAGKIEGRSSFARMGLGIHCTGDFINPGYRGYMPVELYNYSPNSIKIFPFIPICQLMLIKLSDTPSRLYGQEELNNKYMDDDGGPSYWWRDKRIKSLQKTFRDRSVELKVQEELFSKIGVQEPEIIERFEECVCGLPDANRENADALLEIFINAEKRNRTRDKIIKGFSIALFPLMGSASISAFFISPITLLHYSIWAITAFCFVPFILTLRDEPKQYLCNIS